MDQARVRSMCVVGNNNGKHHLLPEVEGRSADAGSGEVGEVNTTQNCAAASAEIENINLPVTKQIYSISDFTLHIAFYFKHTCS